MLALQGATERDVEGTIARLLGILRGFEEAQTLLDAVGCARTWLKSPARPPQPLDLAAPPAPTDVLNALTPNVERQAPGRSLHYLLRDLEDVHSWTFGTGVSLGRELSDTLALAAVLANGSASAPATAFAHFEISGVKAFLHPESGEITARALRGRYLFIRLLTEWAIGRVTAALSLSELNCVWLGVARGLLLISGSDGPKLETVAARLTRELETRVPGFRVGLRWEPIPNEAWREGDIRAAMKAGFSDKPELRSWVSAERYEPVAEIERPLQDLAAGFEAARPISFASSRSASPLHPALDGWLAWTKRGLPSHGDYQSWMLCPTATSKGEWPDWPLMRLSGFSILRADISGYKTVMHETGGSGLPGPHTHCLANQTALIRGTMDACEAVNAKVEPERQVMLLHVFSDDAVVLGSHQSVSAVSERLAATCGGLGHALDIGVAAFPAGASAADIARASHRALADVRARRLARDQEDA